MTPYLDVQIEGPIARLTINRPESSNALGEDSADAFEAAFAAIEADPQVRVAVLTGAGKAFCAGGDLAALQELGRLAQTSGAQVRDFYRQGIQRIPRAFERLTVPVIAAVNGPAIGAGCDIACMCDIRIASSEARFAESFVKLGLIPGDGGAWFLPRVVGLSRASEMAFTGDTVSADQALAMGLVSRVVPAGELLAIATALAQRIAANPVGAVRMTKTLLREARDGSLDTVLEMSAALQALAHQSEAHRDAVQAMLQRIKK